jgi:AcrR family transcriptional regulator
MSAEKNKTDTDTRDRLIASAKTLFAQRGYDGTSVKELAEAAGVNVSLISYHFGGKEGLYRTCLEQFGKARLASAQRVLQSPRSIEEMRFRLQMFTEEMFACNMDDPETARIIHRECDLDHPTAWDIFRDTFLKVFETLVEFLHAAQVNGLVRKDLEAKQVATFFFGGMIHHVRGNAINEKVYGNSLRDKTYRDNVVKHVITLFIDGCIERSPQ